MHRRPTDWPARIAQALTRARSLASMPEWWEAGMHAEVVAAALGDEPTAFLAWAREDPWWTLVVAECATRVCAKPAEAAAFVLVEGLRQQLVDEGCLEDD